MSDKKPEIIPISMVYQPNSRLQNCKLLINRSDNNQVGNFDLATSSNLIQSGKNITGLTRLQSVVKVSNNATNQPIVRTLGAARMTTIGRVLPSISTQQQPTLIMQSGKSFFTQQQLQQKQFQQKQQLTQQPIQQTLHQQSIQQQQIFQPNSQTILIPQSIKSPSNIIYQALPLSTTQRISKSFVKRSNSNTTIDNNINNNNQSFNNNLNKSFNNLSSLNNNNNNININKINKISNSIPNISSNNINMNINNINNSNNNNNNNNSGTKIYRVLGGPSAHIKTTSIIKPPNTSIINKSKSMTIVNPPQQVNRSLVQTTTTTTPRLILPATNNNNIPPSKHTPPSSITYISTTTSTPLSHNNHHSHHRNAIKTETATTPVVDTIISTTPPSNNNLSFSLIHNPSGNRSNNEPSTTPSNNNILLQNNNSNNNILLQNNNNILLQNHNKNNNLDEQQQQPPFNLDFVQGYRAKVNEQQQKQQNWLTSIESNLRQRKPCNCTKSQCLKLYCECFANGEFCKDCNCCNCANNLEHEDERARAVRNCIERNPHAFHPKIGKGGSNRHHNKGCNCKRSGCLKNYCECYEAKILCSHLCRCVSCRNYEENSDRQKLMQLADVAEARVHQQTAADNKLSMHILGASSPMKPQGQVINGQRPPYTFVTLDVIEAISSCLIAEADDHQACSESVQERHVLEEFGRCLSQVIEMASKSKNASP